MPLPSPGKRFRKSAPLAAAVLIAAVVLPAAEAPPVLLVVPSGSELATVEAARAAVPPSRALLTIGASERVRLREGVELVLDRTFPDAPPSDLVVVLPGESAGEEEFLGPSPLDGKGHPVSRRLAARQAPEGRWLAGSAHPRRRGGGRPGARGRGSRRRPVGDLSARREAPRGPDLDPEADDGGPAGRADDAGGRRAPVLLGKDADADLTHSSPLANRCKRWELRGQHPRAAAVLGIKQGIP